MKTNDSQHFSFSKKGFSLDNTNPENFDLLMNSILKFNPEFSKDIYNQINTFLDNPDYKELISRLSPSSVTEIAKSIADSYNKNNNSFNFKNVANTFSNIMKGISGWDKTLISLTKGINIDEVFTPENISNQWMGFQSKLSKSPNIKSGIKQENMGNNFSNDSVKSDKLNSNRRENHTSMSTWKDFLPAIAMGVGGVLLGNILGGRNNGNLGLILGVLGAGAGLLWGDKISKGLFGDNKSKTTSNTQSIKQTNNTDKNNNKSADKTVSKTKNNTLPDSVHDKRCVLGTESNADKNHRIQLQQQDQDSQAKLKALEKYLNPNLTPKESSPDQLSGFDASSSYNDLFNPKNFEPKIFIKNHE